MRPNAHEKRCGTYAMLCIKIQSQQEILHAMKELILKQQEAIKNLSKANLQHHEELVSCHEDIKPLVRKRKNHNIVLFL
jgi:hypothetical protein